MGKHLRGKNWRSCLISAFLVKVHGSSEQDAIDELLDYLESENKYPGLWSKRDDPHLEELRQDAIKDGRSEDDYVDDFYICGGNSGIYLYDPCQTVQIELVLKGR